jgi:hypothetical protein
MKVKGKPGIATPSSLRPVRVAPRNNLGGFLIRQLITEEWLRGLAAMTDDEVLHDAAIDGSNSRNGPVTTLGCGAGAEATTAALLAFSRNARRSTGCETG